MNDYQAQADASPDDGAQASEQTKSAVRQGQVKDYQEVKHLAAAKKAVALEMIGAGKSLAEITAALGYTRKSKTIQFLERGGVKVPRRLVNECKAKRADDESEADTGALTDEQLERATILGLTPGRFAYLLTCERGTSPFSHPAPGNAYTRNIL